MGLKPVPHLVAWKIKDAAEAHAMAAALAPCTRKVFLVRGGAVESVAIVSVGDYVGGGTKLVAFPVGKLQLDATKAMMQGATKRAIQSMPAIDLNFGSG